MAKLSTKEIVVRMLLAHGVGNWMFGYELQGKNTAWGFSGVDADTRAHELARQGYYDSPTARYAIGHQRVGKYAQFRIESKGPIPKIETYHTGVAEVSIENGLEWFDKLPDKPIGWVETPDKATSVGQSANRFPEGFGK